MAEWAGIFSSTEIGPFCSPWLDCSVLEEDMYVFSFVVLEAYNLPDLFSILLLFVGQRRRQFRSTSPIFSGSSNVNTWVFREIDRIDRRLSYWLHWANDAVWYVPLFFVFHCQTFDSSWSYCFRQLISGTFVVFWSQDCQIRPRCRIPTFIFLWYFGCLQTNTDKITRKGGCHLLLNSRDYPVPVTVHGFIHASNQIKRGTLDRWLQHTSISEIEWRQRRLKIGCCWSQLEGSGL